MKKYLIPILILTGFLAIGGLLGTTIKTHRIIERTVCTNGEVMRERSDTAITFSLSQPEDYIHTKTTTCPKHVETDRLYDEALAAEKAGQVDRVSDLVGRMVRIDPEFRKDDLLADIRGAAGTASAAAIAGNTGTTGGNSPDSGTGTGDQDPGAIPADRPLPSLLPTAMEGFVKGSSESEASMASVEFKSDARQGIVSLIATVRRYRNETAAMRFVQSTQAMVYPDDATFRNIAGRSARFGTNRSGYASLAWHNGQFSFELLMTVRETDPATALSQAVKLAESFPKP